MNFRATERGQALILIALAAVGLFAFSALAIDGTRAFSNKRNTQNAADTAVLAAALTHIRTDGDLAAVETAAKERALSNGYDNNGTTNWVEVHNPPIDGPYAGNDEYIQVKIVSTIPTTFARVIGRQTLMTAAEAVSRVQGSSSNSSYPTDAVVALRDGDCGICSGGSLELHVFGSGVFSNSTDSDCKPGSMDLDGNGIYESQGGFTNPLGASGVCINSVTTTLIGAPKVGAKISPVFDIPAPSFTCASPEINPATDTTVDADGAIVYPPGHYSAKLIVGSTEDYKFMDGNYCFDAGLTIKSGANATFTNVNIRLDGGEFDAGGGSGTGTFTCNNLLVYGAPGSTGMKFSGNGQVTCTGVTFYMQAGNITWNGNSDSSLEAPTSGPYKGLLMYVPVDNPDGPTNQVKINGNSANELVGSIIAPDSEVFISGISGSQGYNTQIIGSYITLQGSSNTVINYDPDDQYLPPNSPTIELPQ